MCFLTSIVGLVRTALIAVLVFRRARHVGCERIRHALLACTKLGRTPPERRWRKRSGRRPSHQKRHRQARRRPPCPVLHLDLQPLQCSPCCRLGRAAAAGPSQAPPRRRRPGRRHLCRPAARTSSKLIHPDLPICFGGEGRRASSRRAQSARLPKAGTMRNQDHEQT
jgi:hypothetical protein